MHRTHRIRGAGTAILALFALFACAVVRADATYSITDGAAEVVISIDPGETMVWMNTFPVDPGGAYIDTIRVAYGRVGSPVALNGLPVTILLYEDVNGGSPQDAVLKWSMTTTIANANTNVLNAYALPPIRIQGTLVAAALFVNTTAVSKFIGALDTTAPTFSDRSYFGFAASVDPAHLEAIPPGQWGTIESFGSVGNFRIEARGRTAVDDGAVPLKVDPSQPPGFVHLSWTGTQASYEVDRALKPDFSDGVVVATGVVGTSFDDTTYTDGKTWYYRVR
jgi:hypothetical protein